MPIRAISFDLFDTLVDLLGETLPREEYEAVSYTHLTLPTKA